MSLVVPFKKEFQEVGWAATEFNQTQQTSEVIIAALVREPGTLVEGGKLRVRFRVIAKAIADHASPGGRISLMPEEHVRLEVVDGNDIRRWNENYFGLEDLVVHDRFMLFPCPTTEGDRLQAERDSAVVTWNQTYRAWLDLLERGINQPDEINLVLAPHTDVPRPQMPKIVYEILPQQALLCAKWSIDEHRHGVVYDLPPGLSERTIMGIVWKDVLDRADAPRL